MANQIHNLDHPITHDGFPAAAMQGLNDGLIGGLRITKLTVKTGFEPTNFTYVSHFDITVEDHGDEDYLLPFSARLKVLHPRLEQFCEKVDELLGLKLSWKIALVFPRHKLTTRAMLPFTRAEYMRLPFAANTITVQDIVFDSTGRGEHVKRPPYIILSLEGSG